MRIPEDHRRRTSRHALGRAIRLALTLILLLTLIHSDAIPPSQHFNYRLGIIIAGYQFNFAAWELRTLADKGEQALTDGPSTLPPEEREARVRAFFSRIQRIQDLESELRQIYSTALARGAGPRPQPPEEARALQAELDRLMQQQADEQGRVEAILEGQVAEILAEEGFKAGPIVWPPVFFRFAHPPTFLIISPRERIARKVEAELKPRLPLSTREQLESTIDHTFNVSSLVDNLGGLSAFPSIILFHPSLAYVANTIAHEWTHHYLFFTPLGRHYGDTGDLITMNETVASIVGEEVGRKVMLRHYPDLAPPPPSPPTEAAPPPQEGKAEFDFNRVMRETRLEVDRLLAEGKVEEAEAYMESQRRLLVEHGYYLRKLNQAYFAFHGAYATSPASVDPIGPQMRKLRAASPSLKTFLERASQLRSYADLQALLRRMGID